MARNISDWKSVTDEELVEELRNPERGALNLWPVREAMARLLERK